MNKFAGRIATLVIVQIILIIASFVIIVHFESQTSLAGNVVNVAGKNRVLTNTVQNELDHISHNNIYHAQHLLDSLDNLENNINFLRNGGTDADIEIYRLSPQFDGDWSDIQKKFDQYKDEILRLQSEGMKVHNVMQTGNELLALSDNLANKLGRDVDTISSNLVLLQILLGVFNVAMHALMICVILQMFKRHEEQRVKMEKFAVMGEFASTMAHNLKNPLGAILNSVTLIKQKSEKNDTVDSEIARINRSIKHMSQQIESIWNCNPSYLAWNLSHANRPDNFRNEHISCPRIGDILFFLNHPHDKPWTKESRS